MGATNFRRAWSLAAVLQALSIAGCARHEPEPSKQVSANTASLNSSPNISDFALYGLNSVTLRDRASVNGGDVGVKAVGTGPFLEPGFELALINGARVDRSRNVIGDSVRLTNRAVVGDVQTAHLSLGNPVTYAHQYSFPDTMPSLPVAGPASPGTTNVTVTAGQTMTLSPGRFAAVVINVNGKLRLNPGSYDFASMQMANDTRVEALGAVLLHIAGRIDAIDRSHIVAAPGTSLEASSIRIEVLGKNGATGALAATPHAAVFGNDSELFGLLLVPNGTIMTGQRTQVTGALVARDVYVDIDARVNFQSGFLPPKCVPANCDDQNPCTTDTCNNGTCSHVSVPGGTSCSDGNPCNGTELCSSTGTCVPGTQVTCTARDQCHLAGTCDPATGACSDPAKPDGSSCDDGNACTQYDACVAGACAGTNPVVCSAIDQCHLAGTCDPSSGLCSNPTMPDGRTCNDGDACTNTDTCLVGICLGSNITSCHPVDQCHDAGICQTASGVCTTPAKDDGSPCNDGNACTQTDACAAGTCTGGNPVSCAAQDQCHESGICDASTGICSNPAKTDGSRCNDANACTTLDACQGGSCIGADPVTCVAQDQCHDMGTCDTATGVCSNPSKPDGSACSDSNACTIGDSCLFGTCKSGASAPIDDNNPCTADACDSGLGVTHTPLADGTPCGAANLCTGKPPQICHSGQCIGNAVVVDYGAADYRYHEYPHGGEPSNFAAFDFDDSSFPLGAAPFASGGGCAIQKRLKTKWNGNDDLLLRRHFTLPAGAQNFTMHIAIDNDVRVLLNGTDLTGGYRSHEGCAESNQLVVAAPDNVLREGDNLLVIVARDRGVEAAIDVQVSVQLPQGSTLPVPPLDDGNPCTEDSCDPSAGVVHTPLAAGTSCAGTAACPSTFAVTTIANVHTGIALFAALGATTVDFDWATLFPPASHQRGLLTPTKGATSLSLVATDGATNTATGSLSVQNWVDGLGFDGKSNAASADLAINSSEDFELAFGSPRNILGFPVTTGTGNAPNEIDLLGASFELTLWDASGTPVGTGTVSLAAGHPDQIWVTIVSPKPFTRLTVTETGARGIADQYFGNVLSADCTIENACTQLSLCDGSGQCIVKPPPNLDDGDACTADSCDATGGVIHTPIPGCGLIPVPNVVGMGLAPASSTIESAGLHVGNVTSSIDGLLELQFDALPSQRGWSYEAMRERTPEERVFRMENGILIQDSIGLPFAGSCDNTYVKYGALDPSAPFVMDITARLLDVEEQTNNHFGFAFGAQVPAATCYFGLGKGAIQDLSKQSFQVDTSVFHDYHVECDPVIASYRLFVDGVLISSNKLPVSERLNVVFIGDGTCGANARAEVTRFQVEQRIVAKQHPVGATLVAPASPVDLELRTGPATARVPAILGAQESNALLLISQAGLQARVVRQHSATVPLGAVIKILPLVNSRVLPNDTVVVTVSSGLPQCVAIPPDIRAWFRGDGATLDEVSGVAAGPRGGVGYYSAVVGQGLAFADGYIELPHSSRLEFEGQMTVEGWVRPNAGSGTILTKNDDRGASNAAASLYYQDSEEFGALAGRLVFTLWADDASHYVQVSSPPKSVRSGEWVHVAVVADGSTLRMYLDGLPVASVASPPAGTNLGTLVIGAYKRGTGRDGFFGGGIDELAIYGRALTIDEIGSIYAADVGGKCSSKFDLPPVSNAGPDQTITLPATATLNGTATDDGLPAGSTLACVWSQLSGPGAVTFAAPMSTSTSVAFPVAGVYVLALTCTDGLLSTSDELVVTVSSAGPGGNLPPEVNCDPDIRLPYPQDTITITCEVSDDDLPADGSLATQWGGEGPGDFQFLNPTATSVTIQLPVRGTYTFRLTATDGQLSTTEEVVVYAVPPNKAPVVSAGDDQTITLTDPILLAGTITDDQLPEGAVVSGCWTMRSGPGAVSFASVCSPSTTATFSLPGEYVLALEGTDTLLTASDDLTVTVLPVALNKPPIVSAGPHQEVRLPDPLVLSGSVSDDKRPKGGTLTSFWSKISGPDPVTFNPANGPATTVTFSKRGTYVLRLTANDSELESSDDVTVKVLDPLGPPPVVAIAAPTEDAEITTLADVTGTVDSANLDNYVLEYRDVDTTTWTQFASGTNTVSSGKLGTLDPTILLNGTYELRVTATDTAGQTVSDSTTVLLTGNQKVGNFTVSFKDLSVPVAGIPVEVIRTYDSRNKRQGDFGVGWTLDINSLRVQKNRVLAQTWETTVEAGGPFGMMEIFCVIPTKRHYVTVTFADGKVFRWEAKVVAPGGGYNGRRECQLGAPFEQGTVEFTPLAPTTATLSRDGGTDVLINSGWPGDAELVSLEDGSELFDPDKFVVTLLDGRQLDVAQATGLQRVTDTNGNVLEVKPTGLFHSSGKSIAFTRDSAGRITTITDPLGNKLDYGYDDRGDLVSFHAPDANPTQKPIEYGYDTKHYLLSIRDPRGIVPIRNEYDDAGRLLKHTDANDKVISYDHQIAARKEVVTDRLGHTTTHEYDDRGNVLSTTDALGNITKYTYDDRDNKLSDCNPLKECTKYTCDDFDNKLTEQDPLGNTTTYTYDGRGNVLTTKDALNRVTTNKYDGNGNLTSTEDPQHNITSYLYDTRGLQIQVKDALNNVTSYEYDDFGNMTVETAPGGRVTKYEYDLNGNRTKQSTVRTTSSGPETLVTQYTYDAQNRLISTLHPDGSTTSVEYNSIGQQSATVDGLGHRIEKTYDDQGRLDTTTYPDKTTETATYDAEGRRTNSKDRSDRVTQYEYDALGRLTRTLFPDNSDTRTTYDEAGRTKSTIDEAGFATTYDYDAAGRRIRVTDALNHVTSFTYDAVGNQRTVTDPLNHATTYVYDGLNRRTDVIFADNTVEHTEYDALGHRIAKIDQANKTTGYEYDAQGRLTKVTDALGGVTRYTYDELGNQTSQIDALNRTTWFDYDPVGRRTRRTLPAVAPAMVGASEQMEYDFGGNLTVKTDFMGRSIQMAYDVNNRLTSKTYPDTTSVSFTYTKAGRREAITDGRGVTSYTYDPRDRMTSITYPDGRKLTFGYDARGKRNELKAEVAGQTLSTRYTYDKVGSLDTATDPLGGKYTYQYYDNGARQGLSQPNGTLTSYTYDSVGHLKTLSSVHQPSNRVIQSYTYTLGATGIRTQIAEADGTVRAYGYDDLYRLTHEAVIGSANDYTKDFTYDPVGNRQTQVTTGSGAANIGYTYDERDRLLTENSSTLGWDNNGNMTSKSGDATYTWDYDDRLIRVTKADGTVVEHVYDADGVRVQTKVTPANSGVTQVTKYLVDTAGALSHVVVETDGSGAIAAYYVRGGDELLAVIRGSDAHYYNQDGLGSVRELVGFDGTITDSYGYTAFGEALGWSGSDAQPYRFAGEEWEDATSLSNNRARWLSPSGGYFLAADKAVGNLERPVSYHGYLYASANPVNCSDPTGLFSLTEITMATAIQMLIFQHTRNRLILGFQAVRRLVDEKHLPFFIDQELHYNRNLFSRDPPQRRSQLNSDEWICDSFAPAHNLRSTGNVDCRGLGQYRGTQAIYDTSGNLVTTPEDGGSFDFDTPMGVSTVQLATNRSRHFFWDVLPWIYWGNTADDTTTRAERLGALKQIPGMSAMLFGLGIR